MAAEEGGGSSSSSSSSGDGDDDDVVKAPDIKFDITAAYARSTKRQSARARRLQHHCPRPGVELVIGSMFSGKTDELLRRVRRFEAAGTLVALVTSSEDTRDGGRTGKDLVTHAQQSRAADASVTALSELADIKAVKKANVVAIDEGQFYPDLVEGVAKLVAGGQRVLVAALSGTWEQKPYDSVSALIAVSDRVHQLTAVCKECGDAAPFSTRLTDETEVKVVGGADKYAARCRACLRAAR
jgi:thymidine kinase